MNKIINEVIMEKLKMECVLGEYFMKLNEHNKEMIQKIEVYGISLDSMNRFDYKGYGIRRIEYLTKQGKEIKRVEIIRENSNGGYKIFYPIVTSKEVVNKIVKEVGLEIDLFNYEDLFEFMMISEEFYNNIYKVISDIIEERMFGNNCNCMNWINI